MRRRKSKVPEKSRTVNKTKHKKRALDKVDRQTVKLIVTSVDDLADETGWTFLGHLGNLISKKKPEFDPRNYGFSKLYELVKHIDKFEIDERESGGHRNNKHIFLRLKG